MNSKTTIEELLQLEKLGWDALCKSKGASFYGDIMTDDGLFILVNGAVMSRQTVIVSLNGAPAWDSYELKNEQLVTLDENCAILTYAARATRENAEPFNALMSSVYVRRDNEWRLALYQQTMIS